MGVSPDKFFDALALARTREPQQGRTGSRTLFMYLRMTAPSQLVSPSGLSVSHASNSTSLGRTQNNPLMAPDPPRPFPRGQYFVRLLASGWTTVVYCQS